MHIAPIRIALAATVALAAFAPGAHASRARADAEGAEALRALVDTAIERTVEGAAAFGRADREAAGSSLIEALDAVQSAQREARSAALREALRRAELRLNEAAGFHPVPDSEPGIDVTNDVAATARAGRWLRRALHILGRRGTANCVLVDVTPGAAWIHGAGHRARFRVLGRPSSASLTVTNDVADVAALVTTVESLGRGRFRVTWGTDLGAGRLRATCDAGQSERRVFNTGPAGALAVPPPAPPDFGAPVLYGRVGSAFQADPTAPGAAPETHTATGLPAGLVLDAATGKVTGVPDSSGPAVVARFTVRNVRSAASADVPIDIDPALPDGIVDLAGGFRVERWLADLDIPVKMALADDGRLFFNELLTGRIRVVHADGTLVAAPMATVPIQTGAETGLLGLALPPDFATSADPVLYVYASTPAGDGKPARNRVLRYHVAGDTATGPDVIVDDLPLGETLNAGDLKLDREEFLFVTTGATGDAEDRAALAQTDGSLAGRVLRYTRDGAIPGTNPVPGSPEWARGFRNPFDMAEDSVSVSGGGFFTIDNGTNAHDELNYVQRGKNFGWGAEPGASFGSLTGIRIEDWTPVIAPTCVVVHPGHAWRPEFAWNLFVGSYDAVEVRRIVVSGVDLVSEEPFLRLSPEGFGNQPLDLIVSFATSDLYVSTFDSIWRVTRD